MILIENDLPIDVVQSLGEVSWVNGLVLKIPYLKMMMRSWFVMMVLFIIVIIETVTLYLSRIAHTVIVTMNYTQK